MGSKEVQFKIGFFILLTLIIVILSMCFVFADVFNDNSAHIYIHHEDKAWYDFQTKECDYITQCIYGNTQLCTNSVYDLKFCNETMCSQGEGNYVYSYRTSSHSFYPDSIDPTSPPPPDNQIITPWSPVNYDTQEWACSCVGIWVQDTNNGQGACCGDDPYPVPNPDGTIPDIDDPDMGESACKSCTKGSNQDTVYNPEVRDWNDSAPQNNRCCGDDTSDCGATSSDASWLCSDSPILDIGGNNQWFWKQAVNNKGNIMDSTCKSDKEFSYLSNGSEWILCGWQDYNGKKFDLDFFGTVSGFEVPNPFVLDNHSYFCHSYQIPNKTISKIAECCGGGNTMFQTCLDSQDSSCYNEQAYDDLGGESFYSGNSLEFSLKTFYCTENNTFTEDLDDYPCACDSATLPGSDDLRGYRWTGTKCCGDDPNGNESFNDPNGEGACFNSTPLINSDSPDVDYPELKSMNGTIFGCNISARPERGNQWLLSVIDTYTGEGLVQETPFCTVHTESGYYCDFDGVWKLDAQGIGYSNLVYVPDESWLNDSDIEGGCCPANECWNGRECMPNQAFNPYAPPYKENYRCSNGDWIYSEPKKGLDNIWGWCPSNDQCLVGGYDGVMGTSMICLNPGEYIDDNYCEDGKWSSRTEKLALALLDTVDPNSDYVLYCGPYEESLAYFDYTFEDEYGSNIYLKGDIFDQRLTNNFCLLDYQDKLIFSTSLNTELNESLDIPALLPEFENCDMDAQGFNSCSSSNRAWTNTELRSITYSKSSFSLNQNVDFEQKSNQFINPMLRLLNNTLQTSPISSSFDYSFMDDGITFDRLYIAKKGDKKLFATLDQDMVIASYESITMGQDICKTVNTFNESRKPLNAGSNSAIVCVEQPDNTYNIIGKGGLGAKINPEALWADLTGKLRLT